MLVNCLLEAYVRYGCLCLMFRARPNLQGGYYLCIYACLLYGLLMCAYPSLYLHVPLAYRYSTVWSESPGLS